MQPYVAEILIKSGVESMVLWSTVFLSIGVKQMSNEEKMDLDTRDRLIQAATMLFTSKGYSATSITDITCICNLAKASYFYHFSSKQEIALEIIRRAQEYCRDFIFSVVYDSKIPPKERVEVLASRFHKFYEFRQDSKVVAYLSTELVGSKEVFDEPIRRYFDSWFRTIKDALSIFCDQRKASCLARKSIDRMVGALSTAKIHQDDSLIKKMCNDLKVQWLKLRDQSISS